MSADEQSNAGQGIELSNLYRCIDKDNVHGLNLAVPEQAKDIIKPWEDRNDDAKYADSGVDDQLIIHVPFSRNVKLKSILLKLGRGEVAPRRLKIYANHPNIIDFSEIESTKPQLDIALLEGQIDIVEYPLRVAAFTSVNSVSVFFADAMGEEVSRIYYLGFKGDVRESRKEVNSKLEVPASNAADAPLVDKVTERAAAQQTTAR
jgi:hypothetical protein